MVKSKPWALSTGRRACESRYGSTAMAGDGLEKIVKVVLDSLAAHYPPKSSTRSRVHTAKKESPHSETLYRVRIRVAWMQLLHVWIRIQNADSELKVQSSNSWVQSSNILYILCISNSENRANPHVSCSEKLKSRVRASTAKFNPRLT